MLCSALFLVVMTAVLFTLWAGHSNKKRFDGQEQALRACLIAVEHLRSELSVAWVEEVEPGLLTYHLPTYSADGTIQLGPTGDTVWSTEIAIGLEADQLVRRQDGQARPLSRLGSGATFTLERLSATLLKVTVRSTWGAGYQLEREYRLLNQS
jgi:hypothetical protein